MRPADRDLDEEIRGHLALSVKERIERGEEPEAARLAALREFGYIPAVRDSMRRVYYSRWLDMAAAFVQDLRVGVRSLRRAKGLSVTVVVTLALGIGANAAIFSVVRGVLLRPLVNRGEDRLVYIRQSAPGLGAENTTFSVPEIDDFASRVTSISGFGDFSTIEFTMVGFGEPRVVRAGVVGGSYFDVMGLRPLLGRLLNAGDDGPEAAGAAVLTHRFWTTALNSDPAVTGLVVSSAQELDFYQEMTRRIGELPGVDGVALGNVVPWRDARGVFGSNVSFAAEGYTPADGEENSRLGGAAVVASLMPAARASRVDILQALRAE